MNPAGQGQHHADGRVGHFLRPVIRDDRHRDAALAGRPPVDVVVAHAAADDDLAASEPLDRRPRDRNGVVEDDRIHILDPTDQVFLALRIEGHDPGRVAKDPAFGLRGRR